MSSRLLAFVFVAFAVPAAAQTPGPAPVQASPASAPAAAATATEVRGFTYNADGRLDPFVTLLQRGSDVSQSAPATRAPGIAGLGASEITLKGTLASQGGYVAIMQGIDSKTYIVRPGERLADGTVRSITPDAVLILQQVRDSLSLDKQREVRKTLRQTEEAK